MKIQRKSLLAWILSLLFLCQALILPPRALRAEVVDEGQAVLGSIAIDRRVDVSEDDPRRFDVSWSLRNVSSGEDAEPQEPPTGGGDEAQNVVLVLDRSRSWDEGAEEAIRNDIEMFVNSGKSVGIVSYGTTVFDGSSYPGEGEEEWIETPDATMGLTTDLASLQEALDASSFYGEGANLPASSRHRFTQAALMEAEAMLEGSDPAQSRIILVTLGAPTLSYYATAARENDNAPYARDHNGEKVTELPSEFTGDVLGNGTSFDLDGSDALIDYATNYTVPGSGLIVFDHSLPLQGTAAEIRRSGVSLSVVAYDVHAETLAGGSMSLEGDRAKGRLKGLVGSEEDFYDIGDAYNLSLALQEAVAGGTGASAPVSEPEVSAAAGAETLQFTDSLPQGVYPIEGGGPSFSYPEGTPQAASDMGIQYDGASTIQAWNISLLPGEALTMSYSLYVDPASYADGSTFVLSSGASFQNASGESVQVEVPWVALPEAPAPQTRTLKVVYIDEYGNELTDEAGQTGATILEDQPLDTYYNITPPEISGYEYSGTQNDEPLEGSLGDAPEVIYLVYTEAEVATGTVYAHFYKEGGQEITDDAGNSFVVVAQDQPVGTPYSFEAPEIDGYLYLGVAGSSKPLEGTVAEGTVDLQLIYRELPKTGSVFARFYDIYGNELIVRDGTNEIPVKQQAEIGAAYHYEAPEISGYRFVKVDSEDKLDGTVAAGDIYIDLIYEKAMGSVTFYFYSDGQPIRDNDGNASLTVITNAEIGTDYDLRDEVPEIDGYDFTSVSQNSASLQGTIQNGETKIFLLYEALPQEGSILLRYFDTNWNPIKDAEGQTEAYALEKAGVGDHYHVEAPDISGYTFSVVGNGKALDGEVTPGETVIDLLYMENPKTGSVIVRFESEDGQEIADAETLLENVEVGTAYRAEPINIDGYRNPRLKDGSAPAEGTVQENDTVVTYVYEAIPKTGSVIATFVTADGTTIQDSVTVLEEGDLDRAYHYTAPEIKGYKYQGLAEGSAELDGNVREGVTEIVLVYAPQTGSVIVRYESEDGQEIADAKTLLENAEVGTAYQAEPINIDGYRNPSLKDGSAPAEGTVQEGETVVTYVYEAIPKTGSVIATFVTADGTTIQDSVTVLEEGDLDRAYHYTAPEIKGYKYQGPAEGSAELDGNVREGVTEIVLVYAPQTGSVIVRYESEDGQEIEDAKTLLENAEVATAYQAEPIKIDGYQNPHLKDGSAPAEGTVQEGETIVTFVYQAVPKTGSVIVRFESEDGQEIEDAKTLLENAELETAYKAEPINIDGYQNPRLKNGSAPAEGTVQEGETIVTFVYQAVPKLGSVKVYYKNQQSKDIMAPQTIEDEVEVGESYEVEIPRIEGYKYLAPSANSAPLEGDVEEGTSRVYLIYKELPKTGTLYLRFEDEDGKQIADDERYLDEIEVGTNYRIDVSEIPEIEGYTYRYLKNGSRPLSGDIQSGEQYVVLVYERTNEETSENESKTGTVVVHYEDAGGLAIAETERLYEDMRVGTQYEVTPPEIEGFNYSHLKNGSRPAKGEIKEGDNEVTFVYEPKEEPKFSNLSIRFEDEKGYMIHPAMTLLKDQPAGKAYRVQMPKLEGFEFERVKDGSAPLEGELKEGENIVIAIYKRIEDVKLGSVYVRYFNEKDEEIRDPDTLIYEAPYGTVYYAVPPSIEGYEYVGLRDRSPEATGQVKDDEITVSFVYRSTTKLGSVQVRFLDAQQNKIREDYLAHKDQPVGTAYAIQLPHIAGYSFSSLQQDSAPLTGTIKEGMTTVVAVYRKEVQEERGSLVISYIDEAGKEIKPTQRLLQNAKAGTPYLTTIPAIEGYTFLGMAPESAPARGELKPGENQVRFLYRSNAEQPAEQKTGNVIVHYVDELDRPIIEDVVLVKDAAVGSSYETKAPAINGYEYLRVKVGGAAPEGKVQEGDLHVTFIYREAGTSASGEPPVPGTGEQMSPVLWAGISLLVLAAILIIVRIILKRRDDD